MPIRVSPQVLYDFCVTVLTAQGVSEQDSRLTADVLLTADLRGVASHGVAHLRRYAQDLRRGTIDPRPQERLIVETPATASMDAGAGLGPPVSVRAMRRAIQKACEVGVGFVTVRNSNHFGIAGYYAGMALERDCIGMAMTNASPKVVPTFARHATLGTNPIAVAAPAGHEKPFLLDMATSAVSLGKYEIADQLGVPVPAGWGIDGEGQAATDSHVALDRFKRNAGGGLVPLGGLGETHGGYKGYGLALWVEIMSAILAGAAFATTTYPKGSSGHPLPANVGHLFGAWRIDAFRPASEFKQAMDELQGLLHRAERQPGQDRIYIPGEKEAEARARNEREGVPLNDAVARDLRSLANELGIRLPEFVK